MLKRSPEISVKKFVNDLIPARLLNFKSCSLIASWWLFQVSKTIWNLIKQKKNHRIFMIVLSCTKTYLKYINRQENLRYNEWMAPTAFKRFIKTIHINSFLKLLNSHKHRINTSTLEYINKLSQIDKLVILIIEFCAVCCYFCSKKNSIICDHANYIQIWFNDSLESGRLEQHLIFPLITWVTNQIL